MAHCSLREARCSKRTTLQSLYSTNCVHILCVKFETRAARASEGRPAMGTAGVMTKSNLSIEHMNRISSLAGLEPRPEVSLWLNLGRKAGVGFQNHFS